MAFFFICMWNISFTCQNMVGYKECLPACSCGVDVDGSSGRTVAVSVSYSWSWLTPHHITSQSNTSAIVTSHHPRLGTSNSHTSLSITYCDRGIEDLKNLWPAESCCPYSYYIYYKRIIVQLPADVICFYRSKNHIF